MKKSLLAVITLLLCGSLLACNSQINSSTAEHEQTFLPLSECPESLNDWVYRGASLWSVGKYAQGESINFLCDADFASVKSYYEKVLAERSFLLAENDTNSDDEEQERLLRLMAKSQDGKETLHIMLMDMLDGQTRVDISLGNKAQSSALHWQDVAPKLQPWLSNEAVIYSIDHYAQSDAVSFYASEPLDTLIAKYQAQLEEESFLTVRESKDSIIQGQDGWTALAQKDDGKRQIDFMIMDLPEDSSFSDLPAAQNHFSYVSIEFFHSN